MSKKTRVEIKGLFIHVEGDDPEVITSTLANFSRALCSLLAPAPSPADNGPPRPARRPPAAITGELAEIEDKRKPRRKKGT